MVSLSGRTVAAMEFLNGAMHEAPMKEEVTREINARREIIRTLLVPREVESSLTVESIVSYGVLPHGPMVFYRMGECVGNIDQ